MIELRDVGIKDKTKMRRWRNLSEVARYMYTDHQISSEEHSQWFDKMIKDNSCHYWILTVDGEDVGVANIYNINLRHSRCYWAFYLANPMVRGKGVGSFIEYSIMKYVFEEMRLNKLCCEVIEFNEPVIAMHKRFGFILEGLLREHVRKDGVGCNVVCLAMLRKEWEGMKHGIKKELRKKGLL